MTEHTSDFEQRIQEVRLRGSTVGRERTLARVGAVLLAAGVVVGIYAYTLSFGSDDARQQRDAIVVALVGVSVSVAGLALFLRYSLGALLRLWLARLVSIQEGGQERGDP